MFQLDHGDHRPIYEQIKDKMKTLIITGVFKENDKVPSVRELASMLTINPNTIQKAYRDLEAEGYLYSLRAKGSFVSPRREVVKRSDTEEVLEDFKALVSKMKFLGVSYDTLFDALKDEFRGKDESV